MNKRRARRELAKTNPARATLLYGNWVHGCVICGKDVKWWHRKVHAASYLYPVHRKCHLRAKDGR